MVYAVRDLLDVGPRILDFLDDLYEAVEHIVKNPRTFTSDSSELAVIGDIDMLADLETTIEEFYVTAGQVAQENEAINEIRRETGRDQLYELFYQLFDFDNARGHVKEIFAKFSRMAIDYDNCDDEISIMERELKKQMTPDDVIEKFHKLVDLDENIHRAALTLRNACMEGKRGEAGFAWQGREYSVSYEPGEEAVIFRVAKAGSEVRGWYMPLGADGAPRIPVEGWIEIIFDQFKI